MTLPSTLRWTLALVVACVPLGAAAEDYGGCFRVDLATPFVLPDGSSHEAGTLMLCTDRPLNPTAGTHRMTASGHPSGRLVSRRVRSEIEHLDRPQAVFAREPNGLLRLIGYSEPVGERVRTFAFAAPNALQGDVTLLAAR
jgi:hypothetical protein